MVTIDPIPAYNAAVGFSNLSNERMDCAVIALTLACGEPYMAVHAELASYGRPRRRGCPWKAIHKFLDVRYGTGADFEHWEVIRPGISVSRFAMLHTEPVSSYVCYSRGHLMAVVNGTVLDPASHKRGPTRSLRRVTRYYRIPYHAC